VALSELPIMHTEDGFLYPYMNRRGESGAAFVLFDFVREIVQEMFRGKLKDCVRIGRHGGMESLGAL
jgi:hypothetical protein